MEEFKTEEADELPQTSAASPRWTGAPSITLAHGLNEQCVEVVCNLAATSSIEELPRFILQNRDLWRLLEPDARKRVAAFPFVIVDLRFQDAESWQRALQGHLMSPIDSTHYNGIPPKLFEDLLLETLLFARQAAREDMSVAKAMFAMIPSVATAIASLTLPQVRTIAGDNTQRLRVRWDSDPEYWGDLLAACRGRDEPAITALSVARASYYSAVNSLKDISSRSTPREMNSWGDGCSQIQDSSWISAFMTTSTNVISERGSHRSAPLNRLLAARRALRRGNKIISHPSVDIVYLASTIALCDLSDKRNSASKSIHCDLYSLRLWVPSGAT